MTSRIPAALHGVAAALLFAAIAASAVPVAVTGQGSGSNAGPGWTQPKTPWGEPDIEGRWPVVHMSGTPLERPADLGSKAFYTDQEMAARATQAASRGDRYREAIAAGNFGAALQSGLIDPGSPQRQTSLIMDPPSGRLPDLTDEGRRRGALMKSSWTAFDDEPLTWDAPEDFDTWDRCITRGLPASMFAFRYNGGMEIFQSPGYVVLSLEMIHEDRIIPTDGRAPLASVHKNWMGDSRGRWEGNTLVVETTHFNGRTPSVNFGILGAPAGNRIPTSEQMVLVERFTRVSADTMNYEITTTDPVVFARSWTARFPLKLNPGYQWWEYACHEGNRTIRDFITSSRAERAANPQPPAPPRARP